MKILSSRLDPTLKITNWMLDFNATAIIATAVTAHFIENKIFGARQRIKWNGSVK